MRAPVSVVALALLVVASAAAAVVAPASLDALESGAGVARAPVTHELSWDVVAVPCGAVTDGTCLAYAGQVPGPTLDVRLGDVVRLTVVNRIAETLWPGANAGLANASVSFHVHGTSLSAAKDGMPSHEGTGFVNGSVPPGGAFTYELRAAFVGAWHYHDHVLGMDGAEGTLRGLFGALVVREPADAGAPVVDIRAHDNGVNAGFPVAANAAFAPGDVVDVIVAGLGNRVWTVEVEGTVLTTAPGLSERVRVTVGPDGALPWRAQWGLEVHEGEVTSP